jgi:hypothetical protein
MNGLNTLMHASVGSARPDLDRLLAGALRDGRRLRRRRRIGYAAGGLAMAAVVTGSAIGAAHLGGGTSATELQPAASGAATPPPTSPGVAGTTLKVGDTLTLPHGLTGTVVRCKDEGMTCGSTQGHWLGASGASGSGTGLAVVLSGPAAAAETYWSNGFGDLTSRYPGIAILVSNSLWPEIDPAVYSGQDVRIGLAGWSQVGGVADDKQSLKGPHGAVADIVWRKASGYDEWMSGEKNDPTTWTSTVHDGVFVTIQAGRGTTTADIQALGASLTWK